MKFICRFKSDEFDPRTLIQSFMSTAISLPFQTPLNLSGPRQRVIITASSVKIRFGMEAVTNMLQ